MKWKVVHLLFFITCLSCSEVEDLSRRVDDRDFFPLTTGNYWEYTVELKSYTAQGAKEQSFLVREVVEDSMVLEDNTMSYLIRRYKRDSINEPWLKESIYSVKQSNSNTEVNEDGIALVKQVYPVKNELTWNPNVRNNLDEDVYEYLYQQQDTIINDSTYSNIAKVILDPPAENLTERINRFEIYGKGVGLLVKDYTSLKFNTRQGDENEGEIESGIILKQYITAHGQR